MKKLKRFEIVIRDQMNLDWEDLQKILNKDFEIKIQYNPPLPITTAKVAFGAKREGVPEVVAYKEPLEPYQIYITVEEEGE